MTESLLGLAPGRAVVRLAWPVIALGLLRSGYYLADAFWAGRLGDEAPAALSAIGGAAFATWILGCIGDLAAVGTHALVARAEGAGERGRISALTVQGSWLAVVLGVALAAFASPLASRYFAMLGFQGEAFALPLALGEDFLRVLLWGAAVMNLHALMGAVFRALGDTRTPMFISAGTLAMNALLDPILMFGAGSLPRMGLAGAAWATVASNAVGIVVSLWVLAARGLPVRVTSPDVSVLARIVRIGLPSSLSGVGFCFVYVVLGDLLSSFGPAAIAGLGLGHRVESPTFQISAGFGAAAATLVGQQLGAGNRDAARSSAHRAALYATFCMLPLTLVFVACSRPLIALWAGDAETLHSGASYLFAVGLSAVPMALEVVYEGAFAGSGETLPAMLVVLVLTAARVPLAVLLAAHWGLVGVWVAISASTMLKGLLLWAAFSWRSRKPSWG